MSAVTAPESRANAHTEPDVAAIRLVRLLHANGWKYTVEQKESRDWQGAPYYAWNHHTWSRADVTIETFTGDFADTVNLSHGGWDDGVGIGQRVIGRLGYDWAVRVLVGLGAVEDPLAAELKRTGDDMTEYANALEREQTRVSMMTYQRGAVLDIVNRYQLGNRTIAEACERVEEIFRAGMTAEVKRGYGDVIAELTVNIDRVAAERDEARADLAAATKRAAVLREAFADASRYLPMASPAYDRAQRALRADDGLKDAQPGEAATGDA